ncbi:hypothetical protein QYE76_032253 [Lolium multiflorum]|uniref:Uncharacterized protein n=1 Tax=Lolium multiflorum TaxID=4521 RepID=A0AAD8QT51_LOLMU|nr:hypothetical protein QYE76_032253 [Lolium multiflorum]
MRRRSARARRRRGFCGAFNGIVSRAAPLKCPPAALRPTAPRTTTAGGEEDDFEASSGNKKVPLPVTVGRLMHGKWLPCDTHGPAYNGRRLSRQCPSRTARPIARRSGA